ncbi:hypothetical protein CC117_08910 [Parafrankia colletiae]|uniref:Uncharacterized protein n=1 Tax=Parafrankia colletiae TaxID=573497 RepID=A0A1S1RKU4_9ACTN|nr:hypothetical protein [Parafrankia colletiae]MCK9901709.1 hypothetical protein [Frankia sp. Cpl3]OHV45882.1 hypothetical protein CC117_08910 [Parafrankia colletiae]
MSLLGWRQWAVDGDGLLRPAWTPWSPFPSGMLLWRPDGLTEAHCLRATASGQDPPHDRLPAEDCLCGLYAWRDTALLAAARLPRWTRLPCVIGAVRLGGRVIIAERGYRAQRGYPVAVFDPRGLVSPRYSVARYRTWSALVAEWDDQHPLTRGPNLHQG